MQAEFTKRVVQLTALSSEAREWALALADKLTFPD
jgi:hypothetical protein